MKKITDVFPRVPSPHIPSLVERPPISAVQGKERILYIQARLREAFDTLKRLPRGLAKPRMVSWPDVILETFSLRGWGNEKNRISPPTPQAIDRLDEVIGWLACINPEGRRLVWARGAMGVAWRKLEDMDGRSHVTLRKHYEYHLEHIARQWAGTTG